MSERTLEEIYAGIRAQKLNDEEEKKGETLQLEAIDPAKLNKLQLIAKLQPMVKFSEKFLKKMDEGSLRTILAAVLTMGLPRIQKDLAGEFDEE